MSKENQTKKYSILSFFSGIVMGSLTTYLFMKNVNIFIKTIQIIRNGENIIASYHYDKPSNSVVFKTDLVNVDIVIILDDDSELTFPNFTGKTLVLK
tara:strand:- start:504 stop:794 length:291 start_codon:yes stop_codon:yes gene_type:complete